MFVHPPQLRTKPKRSAFSLVELLVVMALIGLLASLAFVMLGTTGQAAREAATKSGILEIQSILEERMRGFENITQSMVLADPDLPQRPELREFRKRVGEFVTRYNGAGNTPASLNNDAFAAEILVRKLLFKSAFPQREEDLWGLDGVSDFETSPNSYVDDSPLLRRMRDEVGNVWKEGSWKEQNIDDARSESAELLYLSITQGDIFGLPPATLDSIDQNLIGDTDDDGNLELLDGWGNPLQFYNFPTRLFKANGAAYTATDYRNASALFSGLPADTAPITQRAMLFRDPDDNASQLSRIPLSRGQQRWFLGNFNMTNLTAVSRTAQAFGPDWYHDRDGYHVPMIISSGPDESLGMALPNDTSSLHAHLGLVTTQDEIFDNITNRQKGPQ